MPDESKRVRQKEIKTDFKEISVTGSSLYHSLGIPDYNPDTLVGRKGLEVYSKMKEDDQIKAVLSMKKYARLMTPWEIQPASQDTIDVEIAEFVNDNLNNLGGTFEDCLMNILSALEYGFSLTEKVYTLLEKGKYSGKIGLKSLKTREPYYYMFESDDYGNLRENGIVYTGPTPQSQEWKETMLEVEREYKLNKSQLSGVRFPTSKFIIYAYNKEFSNWYGRSDLRAAYRSWWSKEVLLRFMNLYMERFGMPTHIGKVPKGTAEKSRKNLETVLDRVQSKYSIVIPEGTEIELLQAGASEGKFREAIEMHNKFISRSILVPDLMGFNEMGGSGSYALGKKHFDVFLWILQKLGRDIEETIVGEQIIKQLVDYNYSNVTDYPKFKFESITAEGTATRASIIQMGIGSGFINPEEPWVREYLALPKREEKYKIGVPQQPVGGPEGGKPPAPGQVPDPNTKEGLKDGEDKLNDEITAGMDGEVDEAAPEELKEPKKFAKKFSLPLDKRFDYKIDFQKFESDMDDFETDMVSELSKIAKLQRDALLRTVERKAIIENKDFSAIDSLQLKLVGDFKRTVENYLVKLHLDSKLEAIKEISKGLDGRIEIVTKFVDMTIQQWIPVPPNEAINFFNRKVLAKITTTKGIKKLVELAIKSELEYYDSKAFAIAGIERDYILKQAKLVLLDGLKTGKSVKEVMYGLGKLFDKYLLTGEIVDDELVTPNRLETIVRTNTSEAINAGRKAMFEDKDIKGFVSYVQYKAILDDRVRPTHAEMHNRIYKFNDPIVDMITPPNGFNCRCFMVPITSMEVDRLIKNGEGIELSDDEPLPKDFPDTGFGKYSQDIQTVQDIKLAELAVTKDDTQAVAKEQQLLEDNAKLEQDKAKLQEDKASLDAYLVSIQKAKEDMLQVIEVEKSKLATILQDVNNKATEISNANKVQASNHDSLLRDLESLKKENESLREQLKNRPDMTTVVTKKAEKQQKKDDKAAVSDVPQEVKKVDIVRCPFANCGGDNLIIKEDKYGTQEIHCNNCLNDSKVTTEGDVYLLDKVKEEWIRQDYKLQPKNITGEK